MVWNGYWNGYWNWYWMVWNGYWNKLLIWILNSLKWILKWVRVKANLVPSPPLTSSLQRVCASTWQRWSLKIGKIPLKQHSYPDHYGSIFFVWKCELVHVVPMAAVLLTPGSAPTAHGVWGAPSQLATVMASDHLGVGYRRTDGQSSGKQELEKKKLLSKYFSIIRIAEISTPFLHHHTLSTPCWLRRACSPWLYWHWDIV